MAKKILSAVLALLMVLTLAACTPGAETGNNAGTSATIAPDSALSVPVANAATECLKRVLAGETQTVTFYPTQAKSSSGTMSDPIGKWLLENLNVQLDIWTYSTDRTQTILAAGDLPDIMCFTSADNLENSIGSGYVLNLEPYMTAEYLSNVLASDVLMTGVNYARQYRSNGTGELYAIPCSIGAGATSTTSVSRYRAVVNWPYFYETYKDAAPVIDDPYDMIDIMKTLMDAYPTAEDGTKMWGTAFYYDTGAFVGVMANYYNLYGYTTNELKYFIEANDINGELTSIFADDAHYYEACKWFNAMYREGVMDPDSINYDRTTPRNASQYYFLGLPALNVSTEEHLTLYISDQYSVYSISNTYGNGSFMAIGAKSDKVDASIVYLNFCSTADGALIMGNGPKGQLWDIDADGNYYATELYFSGQEAGEMKWEDGTPVTDRGLAGIANNGVYIAGTTVFADMSKWACVERRAKSDNLNQWTEMYGYEYTADMLLDKGQLTYTSATNGLSNFTENPDDVQQLTISACQDSVRTNTWHMIYAATDEEFEGYWQAMKAECETLGVQSIIDWRIEQLKAAADVVASLGG